MSRNKKIMLLLTVILCIVVVVVIIAFTSIIKADSIKSDTDIVSNVEVVESSTSNFVNIETTESSIDIIDNVETTSESTIVEIKKRAEASYEEWLAAEVVIGISMYYPDFKIEHIYLASNTELNNSKQSAGVYVLFNSENEDILIHSEPLDEERQDAGTIDIHTRELGFATFDQMGTNDIEFSSYQEIIVDTLDELISQSILVSLYEH